MSLVWVLPIRSITNEYISVHTTQALQRIYSPRGLDTSTVKMTRSHRQAAYS